MNDTKPKQGENTTVRGGYDHMRPAYRTRFQRRMCIHPGRMQQQQQQPVVVPTTTQQEHHHHPCIDIVDKSSVCYYDVNGRNTDSPCSRTMNNNKRILRVPRRGECNDQQQQEHFARSVSFLFRVPLRKCAGQRFDSFAGNRPLCLDRAVKM